MADMKENDRVSIMHYSVLRTCHLKRAFLHSVHMRQGAPGNPPSLCDEREA